MGNIIVILFFPWHFSMFKFLYILAFFGKGLVITLLPVDFYNQLNAQSDPLLLEVRIMDDYKVGHIEGAQWAGSRIVLDSILDISSKNTPVLIYCEYGHRTKSVTQIIEKRGFKHIIELKGGLDLWQEQGYPLTGK